MGNLHFQTLQTVENNKLIVVTYLYSTMLLAYTTSFQAIKNLLAVYLSGLREGDRLTFILLYKSSSKRVNIRCLKYSSTERWRVPNASALLNRKIQL